MHWLVRGCWLQLHAAPSPAGPAPFQRIVPRVLWPAENALQSTECLIPEAPGQFASAPSPAGLCLPVVPLVSSSPRFETGSLYRCKRPADDRAGSSIALTPPGSLRSTLCSQNAPCTAWWHRRSWRSTSTSAHALPAKLGRRYAIAP